MEQYFLMTNNYLINHKKIYASKAEAIKDLFKIMEESEINYKKELEMEAQEEIKENQSKSNPKDLRYVKQNLYKTHKGLNSIQLEESIKLLSFDDSITDVTNIFLERPMKR